MTPNWIGIRAFQLDIKSGRHPVDLLSVASGVSSFDWFTVDECAVYNVNVKFIRSTLLILYNESYRRHFLCYNQPSLG